MELKIKCVNTTTSSDGSQYGKFVIEPLERGFGTTVGNSLRRVLLSSLEGTAVTSARIEGITHEYTAIPGVLEDVIDVMLNLKGLVVKTDSKESQHLRIDVDRPGPVLASDIQLPAGVKVVNPDWLICTVADGGSFHADVIVDTGKGYVPNDVPRDAKDATIDVLPIDLHWFYVFWSISPSQKAELLSKDINTKLMLRITDTKDNSLKSDRFILFDTECTFEESERSIYIEKNIYNLTMELVAIQKGKEKVIAKSYTYDFVQPLITEKKLSKKANTLLFAPLLNRDNNLVVNNQIISEYYDKINEDNE